MSAETVFHYVYIIARLNDAGKLVGPVKVGVTKMLDGRLATLQTGSPYKLAIAFAFRFPMRALADQCERAFHYLGADHRMSGEWFDMTPFDALWTLTDVVKYALERLAENLGGWDAVNILVEDSGLIDAMKFVTERVPAPERATLQ